jgi:hypothetical protein
MKASLLSLVFVVSAVSLAAAQAPAIGPAVGGEGQSVLQPPAATPEMWYYSQELRRHDDPKQAVRRRAEFAAEQRALRLAAMKWYGFSNARPTVSQIPTMGVYSPSWVGNGYDRYDWVAGRPSTTIYVVPDAIMR